MRSFSYLNTARKIIGSYHGSYPLAAWLKQFFKEEKKYGAKDRREIAHICFCFFRLGKAFAHLDMEERLLTAVFLCSTHSSLTLKEQKPEWDDAVALPLMDKFGMTGAADQLQFIFPWINELSGEIDKEEFLASFLQQPDVFLRARPGRVDTVSQQLREAAIDFEIIADHCFRLRGQPKIEMAVQLDSDAVVQDLNSQKVFDLLAENKIVFPAAPAVWDCCAASGGKSILFHDLYPKAELTVSDIRESILVNLRKRFQRAGISRYKSFVADVSSASFSLTAQYRFIICDAPCSGSGTWARTPEQLSFFMKEKIDDYSELQKSIAINAARYLAPQGYLLYITCSVFMRENEEVVDHIQENTGLELIGKCYYKGYDKKADTLFTALFRAS